MSQENNLHVRMMLALAGIRETVIDEDEDEDDPKWNGILYCGKWSHPSHCSWCLTCWQHGTCADRLICTAEEAAYELQKRLGREISAQDVLFWMLLHNVTDEFPSELNDRLELDFALAYKGMEGKEDGV